MQDAYGSLERVHLAGKRLHLTPVLIGLLLGQSQSFITLVSRFRQVSKLTVKEHTC